MTTSTDFKLLKEKKLDKNTSLKIKKNLMSGRIFVEFISLEPRLTLQKNFEDSLHGKQESEEFSKSIRNTEQLLKYFGLNKE